MRGGGVSVARLQSPAKGGVGGALSGPASLPALEEASAPTPGQSAASHAPGTAPPVASQHTQLPSPAPSQGPAVAARVVGPAASHVRALPVNPVTRAHGTHKAAAGLNGVGRPARSGDGATARAAGAGSLPVGVGSGFTQLSAAHLQTQTHAHPRGHLGGLALPGGVGSVLLGGLHHAHTAFANASSADTGSAEDASLRAGVGALPSAGGNPGNVHRMLAASMASAARPAEGMRLGSG